MKGNYKGFWAGMLTMLLIVSLVGTAVATTGKVTKELEYRNISVTLDGKKLDLKDATGKTVEPFMFDGTNYLPVRALAEALGLSVTWDSASNTVVLSSGSTAETPTTIKLVAGEYVVGQDIVAGKYNVAATSGSRNFVISSSKSPVAKVNEIFGVQGAPLYVANVNNLTLEDGDNIKVYQGLEVTFTRVA